MNFLLMFGLCSDYGIIMFEDEWNARHRGLGVKMNLCSALIVGLVLATFSEIRVAIGGPELNPVVFLGLFVQSIGDSIASQRGLSLPDGGGQRFLGACGALLDVDPAEALRRLADDAGSREFCMGRHYSANAADCDGYHDELRATTIFAVAVSSLVLAVIFFCLGRFKMTRLVSYLPTNVMEAFLSCIGYKVFTHALKFCNYKPKQFVPAACIGVPLYFLKAMHVGNPAVVFSLVLLTPLAIFYIIVYGSGGSLASARSDGWMFDELEDVEFWSVWADSVGKAGDINVQAWLTTLADFAIMIIVVLLDSMLKLSSTESVLPVKFDKDYEVQLYGLGNLLTAMCGSSVGYMQVKFNVMNYVVMGNVKDRRGGAIYALLCGASFFWSSDLFNYLPRFFLSTLLFFAGSGFVAENLWGSRKYLSVSEWLQIFVILAVFILSDSLLYAVIAGGLITGATFIIRYSKIPCMVGKPMYGGEGRPLESCGTLTQRKIQHVANSWMLIIRLKGYIFFASAQKLVGWVVQDLERQRLQGLADYQRIHYLILDCPELDGLDSSASKAFGKLATAARELHVRILWSGVPKEVVGQLKSCGTITSDSQLHTSLLEARHDVEVSIQRYLMQQQETWLQLHPLFSLVHDVLKDRMALEPFEDILRLDTSRLGCPWQYCSRMKIKAFSTVLWEANRQRETLFLVHSGKVGMFTSMPSESSGGAWQLPVAVYGRGSFLNCEALLERTTRLHAVALEDGEVLCFSEAQRRRMLRERPAMAEAFLRAVLRQGERSQEEGATAGPSSEDPESSPESAKSQESAVWEDIAPYLQGLHIARGLAGLGLLEVTGCDVMPTLTKSMVKVFEENLMTAFQTYAVHLPAEPDAQPGICRPCIPAHCIGEALIHAGLYGLALTERKIGTLTEPQFIELGLEIAVAGLSSLQVQKLRILYELGVDDCSCVDREGVSQLLREAVHPALSLDRVNDLVSLCAGATATSVNEQTFLGMMSRLVRKHELDWCVLLALRDLLGSKESASLDDRVTPEMLLKNGYGRKLTLEEAEELLWSVNLLANLDRASLDIRMVVLALWPIEIPVIALPPPPSDTMCHEVPEDQEQSRPPLATPRCLASGVEGSDWNTWKRVSCHRAAASQEPRMVWAEEENAIDVVKTEQSPDTCRARLHLFLDYPESSNAASRWSVVMGIFIMISVLTLVLGPLISPPDEAMDATEEAVWETFEGFFTAVFTLEYFMRFSVADALGNQTFVGFLKVPMNICDIVAILPWYIDLMVGSSAEEFRLVRIVRLMRLARLARLGRLAKKSAAFAPIAMILVVIWGIFMKNNV